MMLSTKRNLSISIAFLVVVSLVPDLVFSADVPTSNNTTTKRVTAPHAPHDEPMFPFTIHQVSFFDWSGMPGKAYQCTYTAMTECDVKAPSEWGLCPFYLTDAHGDTDYCKTPSKMISINTRAIVSSIGGSIKLEYKTFKAPHHTFVTRESRPIKDYKGPLGHKYEAIFFYPEDLCSVTMYLRVE
eukprot:Nk52_evm7s267 gene=Nk52_evmTU7s267